MKAIALATILTAGVNAPAAFAAFTPAQLIEATELALADFQATNPGHASHVSGFKAWKSGRQGKVTIYVAHGSMNMEFNYTCDDYDSEIECLSGN